MPDDRILVDVTTRILSADILVDKLSQITFVAVCGSVGITQSCRFMIFQCL